MTIEETISADQAAVANAQTELAALNATLAADQAKLASIQPHLSILQEIENEMATLEEGIKSRVTSLVASLRAKLNQ